ncbi:MAG TPA: iron-sulfur containing oxygenase, partial [Chloroflexota bacterium]
YPTQEYMGLIFAYLGEGDPPPLPRYPELANREGLLELDSFNRHCNYFSNLENSLDSTHVGFVHRAHSDAFDGLAETPKSALGNQAMSLRQ